MSNNVYNPGETYWAEVKRLDTSLHRRGTRDTRGFAGKLAVVRRFGWEEGGNNFMLETARLWWAIGPDRRLSSHLCQTQVVPYPAHDKAAEAIATIGREVVYNPVDSGGYVFGDFREVLEDYDTARNPGRVLRHARREQTAVGLSVPTEETYLFVLDSLKTAERISQ